MKIKVLLSIALSLALICSGSSVWAKVSGPCADCHTMHNSQNGDPVNTDVDGNGETVDAGTNRALTTGGCIGCHTGDNAADNNIPYVMGSTVPTYKADATSGNNSLAGGNFWWMENGSTKTNSDGDTFSKDSFGHNVKGFTAGSDENITPTNTPPGWDPSIANSVGIANDWSNSQLTCAGTSGCHGKHEHADDFADLAGAHHGDDSTITGDTSEGYSIAASYRFLKGIKGWESSTWEFTANSADRNVYHGKDRGTISVGSDVTAPDTSTISYFCSTCHGAYHSGSDINYISETGAAEESTLDSNPWLRHPSDYDMNNTDTGTEYRSYAYSQEAPVAADLDKISLATTNNSSDHTGNPATVGSAIVTCISCHRAHGSPYPDLLRWDYNTTTSGMEAGGTDKTTEGTGCFVCHTTKDDA